MRATILRGGALALALFVGFGAAPAPDDETAGDLRCMVVSLQLMSAQDAQTRASGFSAMMYYLGRLDGHAPGTDLEQSLADTVDAMTAEQAKAEAQRCGQTLIDRGKVLTDVGQGLIKRGEKREKDRNTL